MITGLFEEIKKVFTGYKLEKKKQERGGLEGAMKRDDVGVSRERLVNGRLEDQGQHWSLNTHICCPYLEQLRCESLLVEVRFR